MVRFEWDESKDRANRKKHGIWFDEAQSAFMDPHARFFADVEHSEHEERITLLGVSAVSRVLVVIFCYREGDSVVRIISARRATKREIAIYEEGI